MSGWPGVSVVVTTGGHPADLRRALASVMGQDYPGRVTCIAVYDGAEPFDLSDAEPSREDRVLVVTRNTRTRGHAGARNTGASVSFDSLIAFCDETEEWLAGKLSAQVEALHAADGASVVLTGVEIWSAGVAALRVPAALAVSNVDLSVIGAGPGEASTVLVDRDAFEGAIGLFDEACPDRVCAEYEWLLRACEHAPLIIVRDPLLRIFREERSVLLARLGSFPSGLRYVLAAHPEIRAQRRSLAGMEARASLACAACGRAAEGIRWALRSFRHFPWNLQAARALLANLGPVGRDTRLRWAARVFDGP